ncbi:hypothetical protein GAGA_2738 [Paraglaciecola agarilytica NO2]|uniref:Uncharacterized protein n=1 Tax=Paraglaciecola agarilytica NO2 TaxID=1125747 RepID=A0ABQ0I8K5_9ALTE|nr:hypothetical protein GAGA_2738 [Paraglaciecola agarilytica NO2]
MANIHLLHRLSGIKRQCICLAAKCSALSIVIANRRVVSYQFLLHKKVEQN